ncbi:MAG TPA: rhomboid family intramembrane serine protease [Cytophagaceae bacterium]
MKVTYNSPVILTFTFLCTTVLLITQGVEPEKPIGVFAQAFMVFPAFEKTNPMDYFRIVSHSLGHANWLHLFGNLSLILVIGPILEEKYGSLNLLAMMLITAIVTGVLNILFSDTALLGASGIVFMFIILSSFVNFRQGQIPLTFILVFILYIGKEVMQGLNEDSISQFTHIIGGICGGIFGFIVGNKKIKKEEISNEVVA